jgi:hypothetical protein
VVVRNRHGFRRTAPGAGNRATLPDMGYRVWCVAPWHQRDEILRIGPLVDEAFEPEVFRAPLAAKPTPAMYAVWVAATCAIFGGLWLAILATPGFPVPVFNIMVVYGAFALGWFVVAAAWPTSIRVVPGRVDIMRGWFLATDRPVMRSIDLRNARVVLDVPRGVLFTLGPAEGEQVDAVVATGREKLRIAHAILRAAISTAEPAPLPEDEAVG